MPAGSTASPSRPPPRASTASSASTCLPRRPPPISFRHCASAASTPSSCSPQPAPACRAGLPAWDRPAPPGAPQQPLEPAAKELTRLESRQIAPPVHGHYLLEMPPQPAGCLVGFHGYGETAERNLAEIRRIPGAAGWALCAVQALHPFYNRQGEVIASWMTRFNREQAIADTIGFVANVAAEGGA